jgi:hypothetical protein
LCLIVDCIVAIVYFHSGYDASIGSVLFTYTAELLQNLVFWGLIFLLVLAIFKLKLPAEQKSTGQLIAILSVILLVFYGLVQTWGALEILGRIVRIGGWDYMIRIYYYGEFDFVAAVFGTVGRIGLFATAVAGCFRLNKQS